MNSAIIQTLLAGTGSRGTPARDSASADESASFREALSTAEGGDRHRRGRDVAEPRPPFGKLAGRLAEAMGPLRADEPEAVADADPAGRSDAAPQAPDPSAGHEEHVERAAESPAVPYSPKKAGDRLEMETTPKAAVAAVEKDAPADATPVEHSERAAEPPPAVPRSPKKAGDRLELETTPKADAIAAVEHDAPEAAAPVSVEDETSSDSREAEDDEGDVAASGATGVIKDDAPPLQGPMQPPQVRQPARPEAGTRESQSASHDAVRPIEPRSGGAAAPAEPQPEEKQHPHAGGHGDGSRPVPPERRKDTAEADVRAQPVRMADGGPGRSGTILPQRPDTPPGRTSGTVGPRDTAPRTDRVRTGDAPAAQPPAAAPAPLVDGTSLAVMAEAMQEPAMSRAGANLAAAVGRTFMAQPPVVDQRPAESRPEPFPAGEPSPDLSPETVDAAGSPPRAQAEPTAPAQDQDTPRDRQSEGGETAPTRLDAAVVRAPDAAPGAIRPSVTVASVLGPLAADPVLKSAIAGSGLQPNPHEAAARPAHSLRIQLRPVELGAVTATLRMTDDRLSVEMTTENVDAYRQLSRESDTIVAALRGIGLQVDQITIQPPQPSAAASARNEAGMPAQNGAGRGDAFGQAGDSSGGNSGAHGGRHSNQGDRDGAWLRSSAVPARDARPGRGLVI